MSGVSQKALGITIICFSTLGIFLGIFFLFQVWHYRQPVINSLRSGLDKSAAILQTTGEGLTVIDQVVKNVYTSTVYLEDTTTALAQTMDSTSQFMDSAGSFVGTDLINTITNTQAALNSAQASAVVIDNILTTMSKIPLIGIIYDPKTPLNQALGQVSSSLNPVQSSLMDFQTNLDDTNTNMQILKDQIAKLDQKISIINNNLLEAQTTISSYRNQVDSLNLSVERVKSTLPSWITSLAWILSAIILWLLIIQAGIFLQGIALLSSNNSLHNLPIGSQSNPILSDLQRQDPND